MTQQPQKCIIPTTCFHPGRCYIACWPGQKYISYMYVADVTPKMSKKVRTLSTSIRIGISITIKRRQRKN